MKKGESIASDSEEEDEDGDAGTDGVRKRAARGHAKEGSAVSDSQADDDDDIEDGDDNQGKVSAAGSKKEKGEIMEEGSESGGSHAKNEKSEEGNTGKAVEVKKTLDKENAKRDKVEENKKKEEEKAEAKRKNEEEKAQAKLKKEEQQAEAKRKKEEERKKKEEERKNRPPSARMPKASIMSILLALAILMLLFAIGTLAIMVVGYQKVEGIRHELDTTEETYCAGSSRVPNCLPLPDIFFSVFIASLVWSVILVCISLMLLQGAVSGNNTASLTGFIYIAGFLMAVQIALATLILVNFEQYKKFVEKSLTDMPDLEPQWAADLAYTVEELWDSTLVTDIEWKANIGCNDVMKASYVEGGAWCFTNAVREVSLMVAITMLLPIIVQVPSIVFACSLRTWVTEERGLDLFATCRIPYSCGVCLLCSCLFVIICGIVVAGIPAYNHI